MRKRAADESRRTFLKQRGKSTIYGVKNALMKIAFEERKEEEEEEKEENEGGRGDTYRNLWASVGDCSHLTGENKRRASRLGLAGIARW